ncbi:MAG TPA: universal stress protein [Candidatus Acidoferrales bacterium]|jgi:nucleotide-binding universal stress UspA family protein|nr:universal stress protein [Candidatus Acidoferrales bacterium]
MKACETKSCISLQNILYATDFSPIAENASFYALEFARIYKAKVFALHVRPIEVYGMAPPESWPALREGADAQAKEQAEYLAKRFSGVSHEAIVAEGDIWEFVREHIEKDHIDFIVMGTHGRKGLGKIFLGSVAESVLRRASCPVLTIGPLVRVGPERTVAMKHILLATSFSRASEVAAAYALSLAQENQALLDIVHVIEPQKNGKVAQPSVLTAGCMERMRALISPEAELWCEPNTIIEVGEPAQQILNVAKARRADLIVLGVKAAEVMPGVGHVPWATAHKIIAGAECPVLTVRG